LLLFAVGTGSSGIVHLVAAPVRRLRCARRRQPACSTVGQVDPLLGKSRRPEGRILIPVIGNQGNSNKGATTTRAQQQGQQQQGQQQQGQQAQGN